MEMNGLEHRNIVIFLVPFYVMFIFKAFHTLLILFHIFLLSFYNNFLLIYLKSRKSVHVIDILVEVSLLLSCAACAILFKLDKSSIIFINGLFQHFLGYDSD